MAGDASGAGRYTIDAGMSRVTVQAFATGLLSALGHSPTLTAREYSGSITYDPAAANASGVELIVRAASLAVTADANERDRPEIERQTRDDVLEVGQFPEIVFRSRSVTFAVAFGAQTRVTILGSLTLHGVTREESVDAMVSFQSDRISATGAFTLSQSAYNIKPVSAVGGTIKLKDEVKGSFTIVARRE